MESVHLIVLTALLCCHLLWGATSVSIHECVDHGKITVVEGADLEVYCTLDPFSQLYYTSCNAVRWTIQNRARSDMSLDCSTVINGRNSHIRLAQHSNFVFSLRIPNVSRDLLAVSCMDMTTSETDSCSVDVIYPAEGGACVSRVEKKNWTLTGHCDVTKAYTSAGEYGVQLRAIGTHANKPMWNDTVLSSPSSFIDESSGLEYFRGRFSFSVPLSPLLSAIRSATRVRYNAIVMPGSEERELREFVVGRPGKPELIGCPDEGNLYVEGDHSVRSDCACQFKSVGRPPGKLRWIAGDSEVLLEGHYNATYLRFPSEKLNRTHNTRNMRCELDWIKKSNSPLYPVSVAYGPDKASITVQPPANLDGLHNVTLHCTPSDVNPPGDFVVTWGGICGNQSQSTCTLTPPLLRHDGKAVTCNVTNRWGSNKAAKATWTLKLTYPAGAPTDTVFTKGIVSGVGVMVVLVVVLGMAVAWRLGHLKTCFIPSYGTPSKKAMKEEEALHIYSDLDDYQAVLVAPCPHLSFRQLAAPEPVARQMSEDLYVNEDYYADAE